MCVFLRNGAELGKIQRHLLTSDGSLLWMCQCRCQRNISYPRRIVAKKATQRMNIKRIVAKFSFAQLPAKREEDIRRLWNDLSMSRWLMAAINKACVFCYNAHISKWKYKTNALNIFFCTNIFYRHCNVSNVYLCIVYTSACQWMKIYH